MIEIPSDCAISTLGQNDDKMDPMQRLEEGLLHCKFGRFNIRLMISSFTAVMATTAVVSTSSFILPSAECELDMNIMQKGMLNAASFIGQIAAALFAGFMIDAFGRKIFLISGNIGIFFCCIFEGSSQAYWMLLLGKLIEGIFYILCYNAMSTVVTEFTHKNVRDTVLLINHSFLSVSLVITPLIAWAILPRANELHFVIWEGYFELHAWNIYMYACSLWSLVSFVQYFYLPESPKFLLAHGKSREALEILKDIYKENTGKPRDSFPIKTLTGSTKPHVPRNISIKKQISEGFLNTKELFRKPLIFHLMTISGMVLVCLLTFSALRLWYPQLSTIVENYSKEHGATAEFCIMINDYTSSLDTSQKITDIGTNVTAVSQVCVPKLSGPETYINSIIMGCFAIVCVFSSSILVNWISQKPLMIACLIVSAACSSGLFWANSSIQIALLISAVVAFMQTTFSLLNNILVRVFPTTVRALAVSFILMNGRIGSLAGNLLFPVLLRYGCMLPFYALSATSVVVAVLVIFLPNPREENKVTGDK